MANSALSNALHSISKHNNIVISGVGSNEILKFDGSNWINQTLVESGIQATISSSARLNANLIHDGSVSNTEFGYISTLSSNAQTQISAKQATIDSSARLDASLIGANGNVSNTEYGYLSGVTSDIQTQMRAAGGARAGRPTNVDNAVITFVDSGDTFAAEANLTFTGSLLTLTGNLAATNTDGGSYFKRTISATDGLIAPFVITATSTNNMLDTFGSAIEFKLGDNGASDTRVGVFGIERDGADNSGKYRFKLDNAGTQSTVLLIDKGGDATFSGRLKIQSSADNQAAIIDTKNTADVGTSATTIYNQGASSPQGVFMVIMGRDSGGANDKFLDLVLNGRASTPQVVSSYTSDGSAPGRTYSNGGETTRLAMASGTFDICVLAFALPNPN